MTDKQHDHSPLNWAELTEDEQRIARSAIDSESLDAIWSIYLPESEIFLLNRGYKYVPQLAKAAYRLIRRGEVQLTFKAELHDPYVLLDTAAALEVVSDVNNWWTYDPDDVGNDADDSGQNPVDGGGPLAASKYFVSMDRQREIRNYDDPPRMEWLPKPVSRLPVHMVLDAG
jgi:hypothetical protein